MENIKQTACLLLALAVLAGCQSHISGNGKQQSDAGLDTLDVEVVDQPAGGALEQLEAIYQQMDKEVLSLKSPQAYQAVDGYDGGVQLVKDDETAKKLASAVYNLLDAYGNGLGEYSGGDELSMEKTTTALFHTAPIDFAWEVSREGEFTCEKQEHVLAALVKRELESGRTPTSLYYEDEVRKTAQRLFGSETRVTNMDEPPYYYYEKEGVYILMEHLESHYVPQILSYEKTDTGYLAEAVLAEQVDGTLEYGGQALTRENFAQVTAGAQHLRYTFREENGGLVLEALEVWRPQQG